MPVYPGALRVADNPKTGSIFTQVRFWGANPGEVHEQSSLLPVILGQPHTFYYLRRNCGHVQFIPY
jgi:hypothetical protein